MSEAGDRLRSRREGLLLQAEVQRQAVRGRLQGIGGAVDRVDRGLATLRRIATPPVLVAGGIGAALLLRRGGARRAVAAGITLLGLVLRARTTTRKVAELARGQAVSRSR